MSIELISQKKFIELNSAYRNRNVYPNPAEFKVNVGNSGQKDSGITALDPLSKGQPILSFQGQSAEVTGLTMEGTPGAPRISTLNETDDFYDGLLLVDTTTSESSIITGWNNRTKIFTLETPFSDSWTSGDGAEIIDPSTNSEIYVSSDPSFLEDTFVGQYLYDLTIDEYRLIIDYDPLIKVLTLESAFGGTWAIDDYYEIVSQQAIVIGDTGPFPTDITPTTVTLDANASSENNIYVGQFIRLTNITTPPPTTESFGTRLITAYDGSTKTVTFTPSIDTSSLVAAQQLRYQILQYTSDNASFLNYRSGKKQTQRSLYRITLDNLVLPNQTLDNQFGGTTAFYPYVYLVFSNDSIGTNSLLNSNNPNSSAAVFRCPITDIANPNLSTFIKIRSTMQNTIRFNPEEDLRFQVFLPNGTVFKTVIEDNLPPERVKPGIQISCTIGLIKL